MVASPLVEQTRRALGLVGVFVGVTAVDAPITAQQGGIRRLESAGWPAVWTNEVIGTDALVRASLWLAATERIVVGTCIANVWARPAQTAHAAATQLAQAHPGRFVLGLGVGNPDQASAVGHEFGSPTATAREYLRGLSDATYPRLLAANGPKLQAVAATDADGALPAGAPASGTEAARTAIGSDTLLVVYVSISASDESNAVAQTIDEHHAAGADHVVLGLPFDTALDTVVSRLESLAPALTPRRRTPRRR